jgi:hypothetical protein
MPGLYLPNQQESGAFTLHRHPVNQISIRNPARYFPPNSAGSGDLQTDDPEVNHLRKGVAPPPNQENGDKEPPRAAEGLPSQVRSDSIGSAEPNQNSARKQEPIVSSSGLLGPPFSGGRLIGPRPPSRKRHSHPACDQPAEMYCFRLWASATLSAILDFTRSPMEIRPISRSPSQTGR